MQNKNSTESVGNLYHKLKAQFVGYLNLGITDSENDFQNARTFILNAISIISIVFIAIAYLVIGFSAGFLKFAWIPLTMPHLFYVLYLNSKGKFEKAKVVFLVMNIIVIGAVSLLIRGDGVEYNLMVTIFLAPFLFSKKRTLFLFLAGSSLMFIGVRYLAMVLPETDIYDASHKLVSSISLLLAVISTLFLIIVFQRFRIKVSKALIAKNELIKEKLTESTQNYRSLFENMIEGFAYCEMVFENDRPTDFIYLDVNAAFGKQTGLKDVIGKKISEVVPSAKGSNTALFKIYERVVASGNPERSEIYSPELEGWYDLSAYCPKTGYLVLVFDQITERKAAEINLQKAFKEVAAYKYALNEAAIVAFTDQNGIIDEVNENFCKISGFTESELIGENHIIINSDFHSKEFMQKLWQTLSNGKVWRGEMKNKAKDGTFFWVDTTIVPFLDGDEKPYRFAAIRSDITRQKKAEEQLATSLSFNKGILASLGSQIAVMNHDGAIIESNKAWNNFAKANGETRLERVSVGSNYLDVCKKAMASGDSSAAETLKGIQSVINNEEPLFYMEYPCDSPTEKRWFSMLVNSFESDDQKIVVSHDDITKRKEAEIAIVELNEHLEQKVEKRTDELSASNKDLAAKNQDITDSITYALRLQQAMLPDSKLLYRNYPDAFIINLPQNIISGDFYWFNKSKHRFMIACADSTGHGVPGAFLSIVGAQLINHAVGQEWDVPSDILKIIDKGLIKTLTGNNGETIADGMDMAFCIIDPTEKKIDFAGAMSSIILDESGKSQVYKGSRFGLGKYMKAKDKHFETKVIEYKSGDMLYLYSDGLKDQFGGDDDKKFMAKRQTALFEKVHHLPNHEQKEIIIKTFREWKGEEKQVDDVMVIGVRL